MALVPPTEVADLLYLKSMLQVRIFAFEDPSINCDCIHRLCILKTNVNIINFPIFFSHFLLYIPINQVEFDFLSLPF